MHASAAQGRTTTSAAEPDSAPRAATDRPHDRHERCLGVLCVRPLTPRSEDPEHMTLLTWLIVGIVGAFLGGWIFSALGVASPLGGLAGTILVAFIGAVVLLFIIHLIRR